VIHANDVVVRAFAEIGWSWGGNWTPSQDYQHSRHQIQETLHMDRQLQVDGGQRDGISAEAAEGDPRAEEAHRPNSR